MKPVSVIVHSSPNLFFTGKGEHYSYDVFKRTMRAACLDPEYAGNYSDTELSVVFDNDERYNVSIEISPVGFPCLQSHFKKIEELLARDVPADIDFAKDDVKFKAHFLEQIRSIQW